MNEKEILIQLLINKYRDEEVTVELLKKITDEFNKIIGDYYKDNPFAAMKEIMIKQSKTQNKRK